MRLSDSCMALLWFYSNRLFCAHNAFHLIHLTIPHRDDKNDTSSNTQNCSPLKLAGKGPYGSTEQNFAHYRGIEVKHGRIAMAVTVGMLVQETSRFNTFVSPSANLKFTDIPNGLGSLKAFPLGRMGPNCHGYRGTSDGTRRKTTVSVGL